MKVTMSGQSPLLFLEIVKILKKRNISYVVIGAFAASFYGVVRASMDVDAMISVKDVSFDMNILLEEFKNQGYKISFSMGDWNDPVGAVINIKDEYHNRVDLLMNIKWMDGDVFERGVVSDFMKSSITIVGLEDFIAMKILAGSFKDMEDVKGVLKVSGDILNKKLLKKLISKQGLKAQKILERIM